MFFVAGRDPLLIAICCALVTLFYYCTVAAVHHVKAPIPSAPPTFEARPIEIEQVLPTDARVNIENSRVVWNAEPMPVTSLVQHAPGSSTLLTLCVPSSLIHCYNLGWTILDNVYMHNGTLYIVRDDTRPTEFPPRHLMISDGSRRLDDQPDEDRAPSDLNMKFLNSTEARAMFGKFANRLEGTSVSAYFKRSASRLTTSVFSLCLTTTSNVGSVAILLAKAY